MWPSQKPRLAVVAQRRRREPDEDRRVVVESNRGKRSGLAEGEICVLGKAREAGGRDYPEKKTKNRGGEGRVCIPRQGPGWNFTSKKRNL